MRLHRSSNFQAQRTPLAWLFGLADFVLPLKNSIVPTKGSAPTACTRASSAWITDNEGKVVEVPTNCARFEGARVSHVCAWYDPAGITNFPKGCNNNALGDTNDASVRYVSDGYSNCGKTGSGIPFAKTTHNGQNCGIADVNGLMWEVSPGVTCIATGKTITGATQANPVVLQIAGHGFTTGRNVQVEGVGGMTQINDRIYKLTVVDANNISLDGCNGTGFGAYTSGGTATSGAFYALNTSFAAKDLTGGNTLATDQWGATGCANHSSVIVPTFRVDYGQNEFSKRYGRGSNQVLDGATSGAGWLLTGLGVPLATGISDGTSGSNLFGADYFYQHIRNELCLISGAYWRSSLIAGVSAAYWDSARAGAGDLVCVRAASYLPSFTSVTGDENVCRSGGVGVCPELPAGYTALPGHNVPESDNFGNYQYSDGSVMVWFSVHYYKYNTDNTVDIRPYSYFPDLATAQASGYTIHRMFYDGGSLQPGFFLDKYKCSNNGGIASSVKFGNPLSPNSAHNPWSALTGSPALNYGGAFAAVKTRGAQFFPATAFMRAGMAMLSIWQGQHAASFANTTGLPGWAFSVLANDGTSIPDASLLGYKSEGARVNPVWPCSDMTHSNWILSTTGSELVTNGTFTNWTGDNPDGWGVWTEDANNYVTEVSGKARIVSNGSYFHITQTIPVTTGKRYTLSIDITSSSAGTIIVNIDGVLILSINAVGTHKAQVLSALSSMVVIIKRSAACDITIDNVSVKEAAVTPVLNATDVRGIPNTATTLTAAANGATITYPVALSGTRAMSIYLKRSVGTGTIEFTHDGTTWTDVTSSLSTSAFFRVRLENKTVSNPHSIGLRFGTSGDAVIACAAQDEDGPTVSTPIFAQTAPMTRAEDSGIVFNRGTVLVDNAGTAYARWSTDANEGTYLINAHVLRSDANGVMLFGGSPANTTQVRAYDGTSLITDIYNVVSRSNTTLRKQISCWSGTIGGPNTGLRTITEGNTDPSNTSAYDGTMGTASTFTVGALGFLNARDVTLWGNRAVTDAQMVELVK